MFATKWGNKDEHNNSVFKFYSFGDRIPLQQVAYKIKGITNIGFICSHWYNHI